MSKKLKLNQYIASLGVVEQQYAIKLLAWIENRQEGAAPKPPKQLDAEAAQVIRATVEKYHPNRPGPKPVPENRELANLYIEIPKPLKEALARKAKAKGVTQRQMVQPVLAALVQEDKP